jgi:5,10-methylene-tetrahydrofolate dehydrogenase/methenyl tetrahydrofolate cyclohydrolase
MDAKEAKKRVARSLIARLELAAQEATGLQPHLPGLFVDDNSTADLPVKDKKRIAEACVAYAAELRRRHCITEKCR